MARKEVTQQSKYCGGKRAYGKRRGVIVLDGMISNVPEVHFVQPMKEILSVIARNCSCRLYL